MTAQVLGAFLAVAVLVHVAGVGRAALAAPRAHRTQRVQKEYVRA